jgi:hypothetical protein
MFSTHKKSRIIFALCLRELLSPVDRTVYGNMLVKYITVTGIFTLCQAVIGPAQTKLTPSRD